MDSPLQFDINGIKECQRNRHPLLFVDRVFDVVPGEKASGLKCFTYNEWFFPAHFDDEPNVPGFIQVESLVQTFIMSFLSKDELRGKKTNFLGINNVKFKRKIVPGDTLIIHATLQSYRRGIATGSAVSFVGDEPACSADFVVAVPDVLDQFKPKSAA
ncbi:3-hydroxyacyl-ACP dehydratase FabZ family protein [Massilia sp. 9I]|uniref:3-hydroxyacyl-ACP dehydratase FabZ family protein n=1 Tax=Massilia sp. 9I TaxID=2653152 RepID=UPI0012F25FEB|nr:3-hydroxyacyl-ACP dehydratase FabZ family protein [Massilia sp. 9I]VXC75875.1 3-hydroxyacyl-(acyl-carrier-protein) dehydratase FabZ [Massilia sp. 9I]